MNANELMLGNYVEFENQLHQIIGITKDQINLSRKSDSGRTYICYWVNIDKIKPIPLAEKCFLDFGLGKENGYPYKFLKGFIKIKKGIYFYKYYDLEVELIFVHQLQNLHFSLTGNYLQFVEPK